MTVKTCLTCTSQITGHPNKLYCNDCKHSLYKNDGSVGMGINKQPVEPIVKTCLTCATEIVGHPTKLYCDACIGGRKYKLSDKDTESQHYQEKTCVDCSTAFKAYNGIATRCRVCQNTNAGKKHRDYLKRVRSVR